MGSFEEDIATQKATELERRRFITESRMGTDSVSTIKIQEEAVSELSIYQNTVDEPYNDSYGANQLVDFVQVTGTGAPVIVQVEDRYSLASLSLTLVDRVTLNIEAKVVDPGGLVIDSVDLRVLDIQLTGGNPLTLAACYYKATFLVDMQADLLYTIEITARRGRNNAGDALDNVTSELRTVIFQTLKR